MRRAIVACCALLVAGTRLAAGQTGDFVLPAGSALPNYDRVSIGQREGIEANAFVARTDDAGANWYNPAGLAQSEQERRQRQRQCVRVHRLRPRGRGLQAGRKAAQHDRLVRRRRPRRPDHSLAQLAPGIFGHQAGLLDAEPSGGPNPPHRGYWRRVLSLLLVRLAQHGYPGPQRGLSARRSAPAGRRSGMGPYIAVPEHVALRSTPDSHRRVDGPAQRQRRTAARTACS